MHHCHCTPASPGVQAQLAWDTTSITHTLYTLVDAMDKGDGECIKTLFTEDASVDFSDVAQKMNMSAPTMKSGAAIAEAIAQKAREMDSMRIVNNIRVHLQGNIAQVTANVKEKHFSKGETKIKMMNVYNADFIHQKGVWKICRLTAKNMGHKSAHA